MDALPTQDPDVVGATPDDVDVTLRVLIVDDDEGVLSALRGDLRDQPFEITSFTNPRAALEAVRQQPYAVIISDNRMPGMTGIELLEEAKKIAPDTVRIILTGYTDLESAIGAINKGEINFFVTKPWDRQQLLAQIREALEKYRHRATNQRLAEELKARNDELAGANETLRRLAERDRMTGLYNHALFEEHLLRQIRLFQRDRQPFCLALGDIDNFKRVNDTYGHPAGDDVIKSIGQILFTVLRDQVDTSYRYGGEEFAILMRNTPEELGYLVMTRIIARVAANKVPITGSAIAFTMSFGVGQFNLAWSRTEFVQRVDQALYAAKHGGKNRVEMMRPASISERA
ncbi:MAG: diguanylate cyclase [Candidatus Lambdaproteobacteria bacterium]|nr:diguanylate cyclase [Candidatus Lambdaproteobacteria bacterium]